MGEMVSSVSCPFLRKARGHRLEARGNKCLSSAARCLPLEVDSGFRDTGDDDAGILRPLPIEQTRANRTARRWSTFRAALDLLSLARSYITSLVRP
jgi:hypothetical protein